MAYQFDQVNLSFARADRNNDGTLDRHEFRNFLAFQNADRNQDGRVSLAEFATIAAPNLNIRPRDAAQAFLAADRDRDGFISQQELSDYSDFHYADINGDGRIDQNEVRLFMSRR